MQNESAARRWLPIFATAVLLGITSWQLIDSSLPPRMILVEIEVVVVGAVMLEITIRLRSAARVEPVDRDPGSGAHQRRAVHAGARLSVR